jgi:hypothetical protein
MKTVNTMNIKNLLNVMLFGILVVMLMLATVGCDKKKSGNTNRFYCPPGQFCGYPGQPGYGQPGYGQGIVGLGYDQSSGSSVFLEFVIQGAQYTNPYYANGQAYVYGQVDMLSGQCNGGFVQPDTYQLQSQYPATIQNGVVSNVQLIGIGMQTRQQIQVNVSYATMQYPVGGVQQSQYLPLSASMTVQSPSGYCYLSVQP